MLLGEATGEVQLLRDVPFGHKICIREISAGAEVLKYGQVIGRASRVIGVGDHTHTHNVQSLRSRGVRHPE